MIGLISQECGEGKI